MVKSETTVAKTKRSAKFHVDGTTVATEKKIAKCKAAVKDDVVAKKSSVAKQNTKSTCATLPSHHRTTTAIASAKACADACDSLSSSSASTASLDIGACCLCHCALDYSDMAAFDATSRAEDYNKDDDSSEYYFRPTDPFLPPSLHNAGDALVYCESCPRLFHQYCHFCPVLTLPVGPWHCLICQIQQQESKTTVKNRKRNNRKKKSTTTSTTIAFPNTKKQSHIQTYNYDIMFQSPPVAEAATMEQAWESDPKVIAKKASLLRHELQKLERLPALTRYKRATLTCETLVSSKHVASRQNSWPPPQELAQCVWAQVSAKHSIRSTLERLEGYRVVSHQRKSWQRLQDWLASCKNGDDFVQRTVFPFGTHYPRRWIPVTAEYNATATNGIPTEIVTTRTTNHPPAAADDDDDGISLDELQCCVCLLGESSDDNDLVLCDGQGCFRAYHVHCVHPLIEANDQDDWFCPLCHTMAHSLLQIQTETSGGDEWEQRRLQRGHHHKNNIAQEVVEEDSLKSWQGVEDVFPEVTWEYPTARHLLQGIRNPHTEQLLAKVLGGIEPHTVDDADKAMTTMTTSAPDDEDDDNVEEDGHFDMYSYQEERRVERQERKNTDSGSCSSSTHSSQVSLVELSSVELNVEADELAALIPVKDSDDESSSISEPVRQSRRLRNKIANLQENGNKNNSHHDPGQMNTANIVLGKRKRRVVDYRKLNDAIFGHISDGELEKLDGGEDFVVTTTTKKIDDVDDSNEEEDSLPSGLDKDEQSDDHERLPECSAK